MQLGKIIGLKVVAIKAIPGQKEPTYILFDDGETFINLYHIQDCSGSARHVLLRVSQKEWEIFNKYPDATVDI